MLRPPQHTVSRTAIRYWATRALIGWLGLVVAQIVWLLITNDDHSDLHVAGLIATVVIGCVHVVVMPQWRFRVHRWEATPEAVYTQAGWFDQERRIAPIARIQTVDTTRGPLEQLFGLATVTVTTASAAGPLEIQGLDYETARHLVDDLTAVTGAQNDDAT